MTRDQLDAKIDSVFRHMYWDQTRIEIVHHDDETITVHIPEGPSYRATPASDDDGYLYFTVYDEDDAAIDDDHEYFTVRISYPGA